MTCSVIGYRFFEELRKNSDKKAIGLENSLECFAWNFHKSNFPPKAHNARNFHPVFA